MGYGDRRPHKDEHCQASSTYFVAETHGDVDLIGTVDQDALCDDDRERCVL